MDLIKATSNELQELKKICAGSYAQNFGEHWNEGGLEWYLEKEYGEERLSADLLNPKIEYYFIKHSKKPVGFIKTAKNALPDFPENECVELEKIYLLPEYKKMGLGKSALTEIIKNLKKQGKKILFLCVIDTNSNAIAFYTKLGFTFHSTTRLDLPYFKEELKGMHRMVLEIN